MTLQIAYFYGFMDGVSCHTMNLSSVAWIIYSQDHELVGSGGVCLGLATDNIVEYHAVIGLLIEASSHGFIHMIFYLDSQLVVS